MTMIPIRRKKIRKTDTHLKYLSSLLMTLKFFKNSDRKLLYVQANKTQRIVFQCHATELCSMAIPVVEFSREEPKIRKAVG